MKAPSPLVRGQGNERFRESERLSAAKRGQTVPYDVNGAPSGGTAADADLLQGQDGAYYRARANHTGTQLASTISDFNEAAQDALGTAITAGAAISVTYNDPAGTITVAFTGGIADVLGLTAALAGKEPTIAAGTAAQYWRGDKSWQTLDKTAVGLGNVDNTSDATKNAAAVTLTNKTFALGVNSLTGTKAQFNTANSDGDFVFTSDIGVSVQAFDADLTTWAGLTPSANAQSLVTAADYSAMRTLLGVVIGTNVQAYDADLTTWAGITPGTGVATALAINVGSVGAFVTFNGALGTPSSGTLTNCTGLPLAGVVGAGTAAAKNVGTSGDVVPVANGAAVTWAAGATFGGNLSVSGRLQAVSSTPGLEAANYVGVSGAGATFDVGGVNYHRLYADLIRLQTSGGTTIVETDSTGCAVLSTTTASAANVHQAASGTVLLRSTSSKRYKKLIRELAPADADKLLALKSITFQSKAKADDPDRRHWGFIAEDADPILPELVSYAYLDSDYEDINEKRLKPGAQKVPDGFQYERVVVGLLSIVQRLVKRVEELERPGRSRNA